MKATERMFRMLVPTMETITLEPEYHEFEERRFVLDLVHTDMLFFEYDHPAVGELITAVIIGNMEFHLNIPFERFVKLRRRLIERYDSGLMNMIIHPLAN